jgi:hypothetical protein
MLTSSASTGSSDRVIHLVRTPTQSPWLYVGLMSFFAVLLAVEAGGIAYSSKPGHSEVLALWILVAVTVFLSVNMLNAIHRNDQDPASEVRVTDEGIAVTIPKRATRSLAWSQRGRRFRVIQLVGSKGPDGNELAVLEGPWHPLKWISFADGQWLLDEARRRGRTISTTRKSRGRHGIAYVHAAS